MARWRRTVYTAQGHMWDALKSDQTETAGFVESKWRGQVPIGGSDWLV